MSGSAEEPAVLTGPTTSEMVSLEIKPDFGIAILGSGVILPVTHTEVISTARDQQESFDIKLRAGNAEQPKDNRMLVSLTLPLLQRGPRGTTNVGLTLAVEADGRTTISAKEAGRDNAITRDGLTLGVNPA